MRTIKKDLNSIGSGWFILRLSNDLLGSSFDLKTGYTENSIKIRENLYKKLFSNSKILVKTIIKDNDPKLYVKSVSLKSKDILKIAKNLDRKVSSIDHKLMKLKTKACRGIYSGDVANSAIRNILSELGSISDNELYLTEEFFDWKCPYTGRDLKADILTKSKNVCVDHIIPQNKDDCGLNVFGNLVYADKKANQDKRNLSFTDFINKINGITDVERKERIKKIYDFQSLAKYNPNLIKSKLQIHLNKIYDDINSTQKDNVLKLSKLINN